MAKLGTNQLSANRWCVYPALPRSLGFAVITFVGLGWMAISIESGGDALRLVLALLMVANGFVCIYLVRQMALEMQKLYQAGYRLNVSELDIGKMQAMTESYQKAVQDVIPEWKYRSDEVHKKIESSVAHLDSCLSVIQDQINHSGQAPQFGPTLEMCNQLLVDITSLSEASAKINHMGATFAETATQSNLMTLRAVLKAEKRKAT